MKKLFFSVAVLAAFASCSKNEVTDVAPSNLGSEIGFTTLNDRITKSATDNGDSYQVYSLQSTETGTAWYINEEVSDADAILSGRKYYWPVDGSTLAFYAYAPASVAADAEVVTGPAAEITIDYVVPAEADEDFTVAGALDFGDETENDVDLTFSHKLSKVTIYVALSEALTQAGYYIDTALTAYTATLDVNYDSQTMDVVTGVWDGTQTKSTTYAAYSGTTSYMILPQDAPTCTITIGNLVLYANVVTEDELGNSSSTVTQVLGTTDDPITLSAYEITGIDMEAFKEGTHYNITIVIDGSTDDDDEEDLLDPIAFYSDLVDWDEVDATVYATDVNVTTNVISTTETTENNEVIAYDYYTTGFEIYSVSTNGTETLIDDTTDTAYVAITGYDKTVATGSAAAATSGTYTCTTSGSTVVISQVITTTTYSVSDDKYIVKVYSDVDIDDSSKVD